MQEQLTKLREVLNGKREALLQATGLSLENQELQICISNTALLLDTLDTFTKQDNSKYLPKPIRENIGARMGALVMDIEHVDSQSTPEKITNILKQLDKLYMVCLQRMFRP